MSRLKIILFPAITLLFVLLTFVFKFPYLYEWDSVNYVRATEEFNLFLNQPHPPGYIGFVFLLKLSISIFKSNFYGFYFLVLISYILYAWFSTLLFREFFDNSSGLAIYLLFLSTPLVFFHSMVTTISLTEGAAVASLVYLLLGIWKKRVPLFFIFAIFLGGLIKTNIPIVLFPLAVYVIWTRCEKRKIAVLYVTALVLLEIFVYMALKKLVFLFSSAPDAFDKLISDYILKDNILAAYLNGFKILVFSIFKNFKNVALALVIQILPVFLIIAPGRGKISLLKNLDPRYRNFLLIAIMPYSLFVLFFYFPKTGYLLEIFFGILILICGSFPKDKLKKRLKWIWIANLIVFFLPFNLDYLKAKVRVSGTDKNPEEYFLSQVVRIFETNYSHLQSIKKVNDYYFSEIRGLKFPGKKLFVLDNVVADYRIITYYIKETSFLIVQKEKNNFIVSFFQDGKTRVQLIPGKHPELLLPEFEHHFLVSSTPSLYKERIVEIKNTIYEIEADSITIKGLKLKFSGKPMAE